MTELRTSRQAALRAAVSADDHVQGLYTAPLLLVEYGDYQCPYCATADQEIKRLQEDLGENLCFVFRNFPLTEIHPHALNAARAAEAAGLQGRFWEMHDVLYLNQAGLDLESLAGYARALELDLARFVADFPGLRVETRIESDVLGGERSGVHSTPSFFINGERFEGDWSYPSLRRELEARLSRAAGDSGRRVDAAAGG